MRTPSPGGALTARSEPWLPYDPHVVQCQCCLMFPMCTAPLSSWPKHPIIRLCCFLGCSVYLCLWHSLALAVFRSGGGAWGLCVCLCADRYVVSQRDMCEGFVVCWSLGVGRIGLSCCTQVAFWELQLHLSHNGRGWFWGIKTSQLFLLASQKHVLPISFVRITLEI